MSNFQEKLDEFYLNYDTASLLKEESENNEIVELFKQELEYPEELTGALLQFNKSYLKSVVMRIKVRQSKLNNDELKLDLLKYNKDLSPILDKLLSDKFKQQYETVLTHTQTTTVENTVEENTVEENKVEENKVEENKVEENTIDENNSEDEQSDDGQDDEEEDLSDEDLLKQFLQEKVEANDSSKLKLVELFETFNNYCTDHEYEYLKASTFKKLLRSQWGKAEGKGEKSVYKGYQLC